VNYKQEKKKKKEIYYRRDMEFCDSSIYFRKQFEIRSLGKRPRYKES